MKLSKCIFIYFVIFGILTFDLVDAKRKKKGKSTKRKKIVNNNNFKVNEIPTTTTTAIPAIETPTEKRPVTQKSNRPVYVPVDILEKLGKSKNDVTSFIKNFNPAGVEKEGETLKFITKGGAISEDIKFASPDNLACTPRMKIERIEAVGHIMWPACEKVMRCGGCCILPYQECKPVKFREETQYFFKIPYDGAPTQSVKRTLKHHESCSCQCRTSPKDCFPTQTFNANHCQCECKSAPTVCPADKTWSYHTCGCVCKDKQRACLKLSSKMIWDENKCQCFCTKNPNVCKQRGRILDMSDCRCK